MRSCRRRTSRCWARHCATTASPGEERCPRARPSQRRSLSDVGIRCVRRSRNSWMRCSRVRSSRYAVAQGRGVVAPHVAARRTARPARRAWSPVRSDSSARPCTSWSSCTENSTSRSPPGPSLSCRSASAAGTCCSTRRRIACTSSTKFSRLDGLPHHRLHRVAVGLSHLGVARDGPRLEQRLELPGLGPALVVGRGGWRRCAPAARSCPPGAARGRPATACPGRRRCRADPHQPGREVGRDGASTPPRAPRRPARRRR